MSSRPLCSESRSRAADGAFSRAGPVHGDGPEASLWAGLPRTPRHAYAVWLRREPHAGTGPAGGVRAHAVSDGPRWQLPWDGRNGRDGTPASQHDETQDDECQQAHEAPATAEAAGTAGIHVGLFIGHWFHLQTFSLCFSPSHHKFILIKPYLFIDIVSI